MFRTTHTRRSHTHRTGSGWSVSAVLVAALMLMVAVGGSATAARLITGKNIKNNTVASQDIRDRTLKVGDLSPKARAALKGRTGPAGADGKVGPAGPAGPPGASGVSGYERVPGSVIVPPNTKGTLTLACVAGKKLVGATADVGDSNDAPSIASTDIQATAEVFNNSPAPHPLRLSIYCIKAS